MQYLFKDTNLYQCFDFLNFHINLHVIIDLIYKIYILIYFFHIYFLSSYNIFYSFSSFQFALFLFIKLFTYIMPILNLARLVLPSLFRFGKLFTLFGPIGYVTPVPFQS